MYKSARIVYNYNINNNLYYNYKVGGNKMDDKESIVNSIASNIETLKMLLGFKDSPTPDLFENVEQTQEQIIKELKDSIPVRTSITDAYGNKLTGTGTDDKIKSFTTYGFENSTLNWPLWLALYNDSWVFRRAIDKPAQDMVRSGISLDLDSEKIAEVLNDVKKQRKNFIELIQWGRLFGGSVAVMMFDNFEDADYAKPININKLKQAKIMSMYVTDRWYGCVPSNKTVDDMKNTVDYGKPYSYRITFADGHEIVVHHDFILRYEGRTAPKLLKNGMLQGWGYAEGSHILNELARDDQLKASITSLINKSLIEVIKMPGMRGIFLGADKDNEQQITKRLEMVNWARNYNSLTFLDKDDEYQEHGFGGLGGLSDLLEKNMWLVSAALEMQGVLYGDLKQGFSNDTEALERYDETISNLNENYFRPCMQKFLSTVYKWKGINEQVNFDFGSLIKGKQNKDRVEGMKDFQELLSNMCNDGVLTVKQYAIAMKNYAEKGIIDLGLSDNDIDELDDRIAEEMEDIDLGNDNKKDFAKIKTR